MKINSESRKSRKPSSSILRLHRPPEGPKSSWSLFSSSSRTMDNFTGIGIYVLPVLIAFLTLASSIRDIRQHSVHHLRHQGFYTAHQDSVFFQLAVKSGTDKVTQTKDSGASGHAYEGLYTKVRCMHVSIMSPICVHIHSNRSGSRTVLLPKGSVIGICTVLNIVLQTNAHVYMVDLVWIIYSPLLHMNPNHTCLH